MLSLLIRQSSKELKSSFSLVQRRTFLFRQKTSEKSFRLKDNIDNSFSIIYKAPMEIYLRSCNYVTSLSVAILAAYGTYNYFHPFDSVSDAKIQLAFLEVTGAFGGMSANELKYFAIALVGFCIGIRMILHKYPLRIYRNHDKYIAVFEGNVPLMKEKLSFDKGTVKELPPTGILPWRDHRYMIKDRSAIMYFEYFKTPSELILMMQKNDKQSRK